MIKFKNIYSGEVRECVSEPHIAAFWGSSDRGPNVNQGQDRGWRLAPEIVVELNKIKKSPELQQMVAARYGIATDLLGEPDMLRYISDNNTPSNGQPEINQDDASFERAYQDEIRALEAEEEEPVKEEAPKVEEPTPVEPEKAPEKAEPASSKK